MPCGTLTTGSLSPVTAANYRITTNLNNGSSSSPSFRWTSYIGNKYHTTTGECIPNFSKRLRRGDLLPHTNFSQFKVESSGSSNYAVEYHSGGTNTRWTQDVWGPKSPGWMLTEQDLLDHAPDPELMNLYVQRAAGRIYAGGHDSLTFLAELSKTRKMAAGIINDLGGVLAARRIPDLSIAGRWLEYRYGIRPLVADFNQLSRQIQNLDGERKRWSERAGKTSYTNVVDDESTGQYTSSHWRADTYTTYSVSTRGSVTADIDVSRYQLNPFITAWELVPFSFVIDWLVDVGSVLEAISFLAYVDAYTASYGYRIDAVRQYVHEPTSFKNKYSGSYSRNYVSTASLVRRIPTTITTNSRLDVRLDKLKVIDLVALIAQRLSK